MLRWLASGMHPAVGRHTHEQYADADIDAGVHLCHARRSNAAHLLRKCKNTNRGRFGEEDSDGSEFDKPDDARVELPEKTCSRSQCHCQFNSGSIEGPNNARSHHHARSDESLRLATT